MGGKGGWTYGNVERGLSEVDGDVVGLEVAVRDVQGTVGSQGLAQQEEQAQPPHAVLVEEACHQMTQSGSSGRLRTHPSSMFVDLQRGA